MPTFKEKCFFATVFFCLAGCSTGFCPLKKTKALSGEHVYAAATIPVSRLEIKVLDNPNKPEKANAQSKNVIAKTNKETKNNKGMANAVYSAEEFSYPSETIYFGSGSSQLSVADYNKLKQFAQKIKAKDAYVSIYGHASSRTKNTDMVTHKLINFNISADRAENVAKVLRRYGVAADKISIEALSDSMPAYMEVMPKGESLNRRVEIFSAY